MTVGDIPSASSPAGPSPLLPIAGPKRTVEPYPSLMPPIETDRLILRPSVENDRARFVELFTDEGFTVFSDGVHDVASANARFDRMLLMVNAIPYAKQPMVERGSGTILGYTGVDSVLIDGIDRLEWGWRLVPEARGWGYATEAATALLAVADRHDDGEMLCLIANDNHASRRVADKVGFRWWRRIDWMDDPNDPTDLLVRPIGSGGPPLLAPDRA
jgi:[ribosomal protein S5]-alanine N-acetyltransferase